MSSPTPPQARRQGDRPPLAALVARLFPSLARRRARHRRRSALSTTAAARLKRLRRIGRGATGSLDDEPLPLWAQLAPGRIGIALGAAVLLSFLLCIHLWPNRISLRAGDTAEQDIIAQRTVRFEDTAATQQQRDDAAAAIGKHFDSIPNATPTALDTVGGIFDTIGRFTAVPMAPSATPHPAASAHAGNGDVAAAKTAAAAAEAKAVEERTDDTLREVRQQGADGITREAVALLLRQASPVRATARATALALVEKYMSHGITETSDELMAERRLLMKDPALAAITPAMLREAVGEVAAGALMPTRRFDARGTSREQQTARAAVPAQMRRIAAGQPVIRAGEKVTQQHLDAFEALGLQSSRLNAVTVATIAAIIFGVVGLVASYLKLFHRSIYDDTPRMALLSILTVLSVAGLKVGQMLLGLPLSGVHFGYLGMMCVASAGMAIALLIRPSVALLVVSLLSVVSGLILNDELRFTLITLASSLVGIVAVATLRNRSDFLRATLMLCAANAGLNVLVGVLEGDVTRELLSGAVWGAVSGLFALALFYTGVAVFERWFGITTHLRLLELSDPATPILQEFRLRVPGTYAHSLMVGNLASSAAEAIGGDSLLVRVAAYYHDLGKMNRPEFFIENQSGAENVHDRISPSLSALVLASHVKEGIEMGQAVGLPPRVLEVIQQHHGTQLMKFFYHRATGGQNDSTLEPQFRYAGPKPQTREAAILMLADGVEAASRTLEKPTPQRIADFVRRMVEDKLNDGQLDECDLTLRDLRTIQDVFTRTLSGTLHARIAYPDDKKKPAADEPPTPAAPILTLATFPEEALSGALRVIPPEGEVRSPSLQSFSELASGRPHTAKGNGTDRPDGPSSARTKRSTLAFTRGGRRGKSPGGDG